MIVNMTDYRNRPKCSVEGCEAPYFGKGYCGRHYQRVLKHGHLEQTRPGDWGTRKKHPLYQGWQNQRRGVNGMAEEWHDFYRFLADVGARPSERHALVVQTPGVPIGPKNFKWYLMGKGIPRPARKGERCRVEGCDGKAHALDLCHKHHARWLRKGTLDDPTPRVIDHAKRRATLNADRLRKYGLTPQQFDELSAAQGGVCAICRGPQQGAKPLSVDHCHDTNAVRGLLCSRCNTGIGMLGDSPEQIFSAFRYLSQHKPIRRIS
jgi:hypothetical protein